MSARWCILRVMFSGLLDIDWSSLSHAYGPAEEVPEILLGLAADDPDEREVALDQFAGAVHHQGDVYDSTVACLPFLFELIADGSRPGRGPVVGLLVSIGESVASWQETLDFGDDEGDSDSESEWRIPYEQAHALIRERAEEFVPLLADPDAEVRSAAASALAQSLADADRAVGLLQARLDAEPDIECRIALIRAAADTAVRKDSVSAAVAEWLLRIATGQADPGTRLAALVHLARSAPEEQRLDDLGAKAVSLLREISVFPDYVAAPPDDRPATQTLTGMVRVMFAPERQGRTDAWTGDLLSVLHIVLGDRVADRMELIEDQLGHPDPGRRVDALRLSGRLIREWRGPYEHLVALIGGQLGAPEHHVRYMAALALQDTFGLAAPAADALAEQVTAAGPEAWNNPDRKRQDPYRMLLLTLARLGDPRAVPGMVAALNDGEDTSMLVQTLDAYGAHRHMFVPGLLRRIADVPSELDAQYDSGLSSLLMAIGRLRVVEALPEVQRILSEAVRAERGWATEGALRTLKAFGPVSNPAMPQVRELVRNSSARVSVLAAHVAWSVTGDCDIVLPTLRSWLEAGETDLVAGVAGSMGAQAASLAEGLRPLLASEKLWTRVRAGAALVRISGEFEPVLPVFAAAWQENSYTRVDIAECVGVLGASAAPLLPLLRAELAAARRHNWRDGGYSTHDIASDEQLLALCEAAADRIASGG